MRVSSILRLAWQETRGSRARLGLYVASAALGVAALVAIQGFGENLAVAVDGEARELLGGDLRVEGRAPLPDSLYTELADMAAGEARVTTLASMVFFPKTKEAELSSIRGVAGAYPLVGELKASPQEAIGRFSEGGGALLDPVLLNRASVAIGDSIQIGFRRYEVLGTIENNFSGGPGGLFAPSVLIQAAEIDTILVSYGSRVTYSYYFTLDDPAEAEAYEEAQSRRFRSAQFDLDSLNEIRENFSEGLGNLYRFLSLAGFLALVLGALGVAGAVHVYITRRLDHIALLRCYGASSRDASSIYFAQAVALGVLSGLLGAGLGIAIHGGLLAAARPYVPFALDFVLSLRATSVGVSAGVVVTALFAALALVPIRHVAPLEVLRPAGAAPLLPEDPLARWLQAGAVGVLVLVAVLLAPTALLGLAYAAVLVIVLGFLRLLAGVMIRAARRLADGSASYTMRQGFANVYRPGNQTALLLVALGMGTFLLVSLYLSQRTLLNQVAMSGTGAQANLAFFDIQPDQRSGLTSVLARDSLQVLEDTPIVTMRIHAVNGRDLARLRKDGDATWAHMREYRSTYRSQINEAESLVDGTWVPTWEPTPAGTSADPIPISVEEDVAADLKVGLGDTLDISIQGIVISTVVSSLRRVDWGRFQTNFFLVFPDGSLDGVPQTRVMLTRAGSDEQVSRIQSQVTEAFPNISSIDLRAILETAETILSRVADVLRFMALFSLGTGLLVLVGSVSVTRLQRLQEGALLKTLGAARRQVTLILLWEYAILGGAAALAGLIPAYGASWALAAWVFEAPFTASLYVVPITVFAVAGLTIGVGLFGTGRRYNRPTLELLRMDEA